MRGCVLLASSCYVRCDNWLIESGRRFATVQEPKKIVHVSWVEDCLAAGHQIPFDEKYIIHRPLDVLAGRHIGGGRSATPSERAPSTAPSEAEHHEVLPPSPLGKEIAPIRDNVAGGVDRATPPKWRNRRFA